MPVSLPNNQVPDCLPDPWADDPLLQQTLAGCDHTQRSRLAAFGQLLAGEEAAGWARDANACAPQLVSHDARGERIDTVRFHPAWHALMALWRREGLHRMPERGNADGFLARGAAFFMAGQLESGALCPTTMTFAAQPLLASSAYGIAWLPGAAADGYDSRDVPWRDKHALVLGMGLTERQGGSDLRGNEARAVASDDGSYRLSGHKWFYSAPMADGHLVLSRQADAHDALSCFLLPRWRRDSTRNGVAITRLKDKVGNRSNASAEVVFDDAEAWPCGEAGRGIRTLIEMATYTRLDCVLGSAALMRGATAQAVHHARCRHAFGRTLAAQPLMQAVLADLALETEAATRLALALAAAFGRADALSLAWRRIVTPAAKFWVCKRAEAVCAEAMEVCGGNGYVETGPLARYFREAPVNSIWEGSGNVMCLDVLRAVRQSPELAEVLLADLAAGVAADKPMRHALGELQRLFALDAELLQARARAVATTLALLVQGVLMRRGAPDARADLFVASRFGEGGALFGALDADAATRTAVCAGLYPERA
ncbi:acyl-CoA dehydrogenase family protein [Crenobacter caeni]|uniref:DNA alkylation response protein n=1 Tax=Crenobacter caeni TaxID=2705474 RepID=A0A6B2KRJ7_9NEIS|nr:acyl-CoA dehydrogenase family protein [Crenobacter caeni]NDV12856.1 DNA alkylation response protein [Crenobacter caeni]